MYFNTVALTTNNTSCIALLSPNVMLYVGGTIKEYMNTPNPIVKYNNHSTVDNLMNDIPFCSGVTPFCSSCFSSKIAHHLKTLLYSLNSLSKYVLVIHF